MQKATAKSEGVGARLDHLFMGIPMTWPRVAGFAVVAGVITAALNLVPALANTSATDIAVTYEWWLLFGTIIATNCEKPVEAGLKVFVFFLVSQPLVYLVETPFLGVHVWGYYPYWFAATLICLPAGMLANTMRRRGVPGTVVLVMALAMLALSAGVYGWLAWFSFPRHLITLLATFAIMAALVVEFSRPGTARVALGIVAVALVGASVAYQLWGVPASSGAYPLPDGTWTATVEGIGEAQVEGDQVVYTTSQLGSGVITCTSSDGQTLVFDVTTDGSRAPRITPRSEG